MNRSLAELCELFFVCGDLRSGIPSGNALLVLFFRQLFVGVTVFFVVQVYAEETVLAAAEIRGKHTILAVLTVRQICAVIAL